MNNLYRQELRELLLTPITWADITPFCPTCQAQLPLFVTDEMGDRPVDALYPEIARHLEICQDCLAEYEALSEMMWRAFGGVHG